MEKVTDQKTIKQLQLAALNELIDFCKKNGLRYFMAYGTLLGAVRHGGYIPWDDDIDLAMPREDYDKLICLSKDWKGRYQVYCFENTPKYIKPYAKLVDTFTEIKEKDMIDDEYGLYIDIFPLDGLGNNRFLAKVKGSTVNFLRNRIYGIAYHQKNNVIKEIIVFPFKMLGIQRLYRCIMFLCRRKQLESSKFCGNIVNGYGVEILDSSLFENRNFNFEGIQLNGIKGWDAYLKLMYGDYMALPPENERISHDVEVWLK